VRVCSTATGSRRCTAARVPELPFHDPAFAYEVGVLVRDGTRVRTRARGTASTTDPLHENYVQPAMPEVSRTASCGHVPVPARAGDHTHRAQILRERTVVLQALEAQEILASTTTSPPTCGRFRAGNSCATTRSSASGGTACTRPASPHALVPNRYRCGGPDRRRLRLGAGRPDRWRASAPALRRAGYRGYGFSTYAPAPRHFEVDAAMWW